MSKITVSVIGVTGYTGTELLRILLQHPHIEIKHLVSRQYQNTPLAEVFPRLKEMEQAESLVINNTDPKQAALESDVVFLCLPHMASQDIVPDIIGKTKIIDLSADFRLKDPELFKKYYKEDHKCPDLLGGQFIYGLPEIFRDDIKGADAVANPGCFALLTQVMLFPFKHQITHAHVMAISGTTGGGRKPRDPIEHPFCAQNMKSYLVNEHRHMPEIEDTIDLKHSMWNFLPSVGPFLRGIFATAFIRTGQGVDFANMFYEDEAFVRNVPETHMTNVVSTNYLDVHYREGEAGMVIAQGALDNLLKGAAGTAVQNMNLMCGFDEKAGLDFTTPVYP